VVTPPRVYIAGTHATGKTTLARRIEMELRAGGLIVARTGGLATRAAAAGFPKMTRHTAQSTEWIITAGAAARLEAERSADVVIVDGTPYDALAYYRAALQHRCERPESATAARLTDLARLHTSLPTCFLATVLDPAQPLDQEPAKDADWANAAFRAAVHQHLHQLLAEHDLPHLRVPSGDQAAAAATAVETVTAALAEAEGGAA
jgi:hypothetical protein